MGLNMKNRLGITITVELILLLISILFAVLWAMYPAKNYEPYLAISTVALAILEFIRRKMSAIDLSKAASFGKGEAIERAAEQVLVKPLPPAVSLECMPKISSITVRQIVDSINNAPPFQKAEMAEKYNGIIVEWTGYLKEASEDFRDKSSAKINLNVERERIIGCSFWTSVKVNDFPEIKTLPRMSAVRVRGVIESASGDGLSVTLKPINVEVIERA